jgi:hypothetical protein
MNSSWSGRAARVSAVALLVALGSCGGGGNSGPSPIQPTPTPPPTTLAPATLAELSASLASPQKDAKLNCRQQVKAEVKLTNRAQSRVVVDGIERVSRIASGDCTAGAPYTYGSSVGAVEGSSTATLFDGPIYTGGSGCCIGGNDCGGGSCVIEQTFTVLTRLGRVSAGKFSYRVTFTNCSQCDSLAGGFGCARPSTR